MKTYLKIIDYISKNRQASGKELSEYLSGITPRAVRKQLKNLLAGEVIGLAITGSFKGFDVISEV